MTLHEQLINDIDNLENDAMQICDLQDIWQNNVIYHLCVATLHILRWIIKREEH